MMRRYILIAVLLATGVLAQPEEPRTMIEVPLAQQKKMGVRTVAATRESSTYRIRTVGTVAIDQTTERHIHVRINGWIERLYADAIGKPVQNRQPLFGLYSPELVSTQEDYIGALEQGQSGIDLAKSAIDRLRLWDVPEREINRLIREKKPSRVIEFDSPVNGIVVDKLAIQGMYVTPEMELYHLADLSKIWIMATLYERDISEFRVGDKAVVQLAYNMSKTYAGKINYIYPDVDVQTRTVKARIELVNPQLSFKPGMFVNVDLVKEQRAAIVIPDDAVIDTGLRRLVFMQTSPFRFEPREVALGVRFDRKFVVLSGLVEGEKVVVSAQFLIDAESRFQATLRSRKTPRKGPGHSGHGK